MANDYIWNIEMQKAKEANKIIVPITLRACDYKKYFADYFGEDKQGFLTQKQFNKGQEEEKTKERDIIWIASEQNSAKRDEYYNFIVEGLKKIIFRAVVGVVTNYRKCLWLHPPSNNRLQGQHPIGDIMPFS